MLSVPEKARLLSFAQVEAHFANSKFIYWEEYAKILYQSWLSGRNLIVYGRGGFGKSEMTLHFFSLLKQVLPDYNQYVLDCGGADSTKIWGGLDTKELPNFVYNLEASWLSAKYVVMEELFDAMLSALVEMKQTLTSKKFASPLQEFAMETEWLVCLTNKSKAEVLASVGEESVNTVEAMLQRFPLAYQLEWSKEQLQSTISWLYLVEKIKPSIREDVKELFAQAISFCHRKYKAGHDFMSPRSVLHLLHTTEAWSISTNRQLTIDHFLETSWAYPEPARQHFQSQKVFWVEPEEIFQPDLSELLEEIKRRIVELDSNVKTLRAQDEATILELDSQVRELTLAFPDDYELSDSWQCVRDCYYQTGAR